MKRHSFVLVVVGFLALLGVSCNGKQIVKPDGGGDSSGAGSQNPAPAVKIADVFERGKSQTINKLVDGRPNEFYVALEVVPEWMPNSNEDCVDNGFWSWLRGFIGVQDAAEVTLTAELSGSGMQQKITVPLFVVGKTESPSAGKPKCYSNVTAKPITPIVLAKKSTNYDVLFQVYHSKSTDFNAAQNLVELTSDLLKIAGGSLWLTAKLGTPPVQEAAARLDRSLQRNWSRSSEDKFSTSMLAFPLSASDISGFFDTIRLHSSRIEASAGGLRLGRQVPMVSVRLEYVDSLFANKGQYPKEPSAILTTVPGISSPENATIGNVLSGQGFKGVTRVNLTQMNTIDQLETHCNSLKEEFSANLSSLDALVARFSVINSYCPYYRNSLEARNSSCFSAEDIQKLGQIGANYRFAELKRETPTTPRDAEIKKLLEPAVSAIRSKDPNRIKKIFTSQKDSHFLNVLPGTKLPSSNQVQSWSESGERTSQVFCELAKMISRIGCFQAPQTKLLNAGVVLLIGDAAVGSTFHFGEAGKLEGVTLGPFNSLRRIYGFPDEWPGTSQSCPLVE